MEGARAPEVIHPTSRAILDRAMLERSFAERSLTLPVRLLGLETLEHVV